jgi:hypothetical protein
VAAGVADDPYGGVQPGAHDPSGLDGRAVARGQSAQVAGGGDARVQGLPQPRGGVQGDQDRVEFAAAAGRRALRVGEVGVAVEEAGEYGAATGVDDTDRPWSRRAAGGAVAAGPA